MANMLGGGNDARWGQAVKVVLVTLAVVLVLMFTGFRVETGPLGQTGFVNVDINLVDQINGWFDNDVPATTEVAP